MVINGRGDAFYFVQGLQPDGSWPQYYLYTEGLSQ